MAETVTISKEYFDTLLRRTEYQAEGTVTIPQYEFDFLLKAARDYHNLRSALITGGVEAATLDILVNETTEDTLSSPEKATQGSPLSKQRSQPWSAQAIPFVPRADKQTLPSVRVQLKSSPSYDKTQIPSSDNANPDDLEDLNYDDMGPAETMTDNQQYESERGDANFEDRSIVLKGISPFTTLADVLAIIRGGAVLNIYLRHRDRTAHVAFVEANAAEKFLIHAKRTDIYIKGKRIEVFWDDRQHFLQGHLARRIYNNGATRNLIIAKADMTEESIREDLDHIYRLEVVGIHFEFGNALVMLNSIQQAITARSCMSSRFKYKGTRIFSLRTNAPNPCHLMLDVNLLPELRLEGVRSRLSQTGSQSLTVDDKSSSSIGLSSPVEV